LTYLTIDNTPQNATDRWQQALCRFSMHYS